MYKFVLGAGASTSDEVLHCPDIRHKLHPRYADITWHGMQGISRQGRLQQTEGPSRRLPALACIHCTGQARLQRTTTSAAALVGAAAALRTRWCRCSASRRTLAWPACSAAAACNSASCTMQRQQSLRCSGHVLMRAMVPPQPPHPPKAPARPVVAASHSVGCAHAVSDGDRVALQSMRFASIDSAGGSNAAHCRHQTPAPHAACAARNTTVRQSRTGQRT